ncbi:hypothetical protein V6N11_021747 [Hibiscus sabdariffa]|uniref:Uncharacterized protein n=1 Tax=Hibiscus sabdariffa TaxID=183260 RepID=A0ABR2TH58_9ROSI
MIKPPWQTQRRLTKSLTSGPTSLDTNEQGFVLILPHRVRMSRILPLGRHHWIRMGKSRHPGSTPSGSKDKGLPDSSLQNEQKGALNQDSITE